MVHSEIVVNDKVAYEIKTTLVLSPGISFCHCGT